VYAGLVPVEFHPVNDVEWIDPGPGLRFGRGGIAYGDEALHWNSAGEAGEVSVELWVVPADEPDERLGQIFSLFDGAAVEPLLVAQWKSGLVIRNRVSDAIGRSRYRELGALGLLFRGQLHYIALTSGSAGTAVFLDGRETAHRSNIPVIDAGEEFRGRLVLGNSPTGTAPWKGDLQGVAVYQRALGADEIARHHTAVRAAGVASLASEEGLVALYPFEERTGEAARSRAAAGPPLRVPLDFHRLRMPILQRPTLRGRSPDAYGWDALKNVIAFAPLGFFAVAVARRRGVAAGAPAVACAVVLGLALSLGIELVQVHLPARVSSATDVACNTLGSALGAWLALRGPLAARVFVSDAAG
jgi:VanZ family protein